MTDFLVLKKNGPEFDDYVVCTIILGLKKEGEETAADVAQRAIEQATDGAGEYLAVPMSSAITREAAITYELREPVSPEEEARPEQTEEAAVAEAEAAAKAAASAEAVKPE